MTQIIHEQPQIVAAAERQMQTWVRTQEQECRLRIDRPTKALHCGPYLALSREAGAGASVIAQRVGKALGWEVLDRNMLDQLAEKFHVPSAMLQQHDETPGNWFVDVLGSLVDQSLVSAERYLVYLERLLIAAAKRGRVVFVGRGAPFLLPRSGGLSIRVVAPVDFRVRRIMRREGLDQQQARRRMELLDHGRASFVNRYFHRNINDVSHYDLVVNTGRLGIEAAADLVMRAVASFQPG